MTPDDQKPEPRIDPRRHYIDRDRCQEAFAHLKPTPPTPPPTAALTPPPDEKVEP